MYNINFSIFKNSTEMNLKIQHHKKVLFIIKNEQYLFCFFISWHSYLIKILVKKQI